MAFRPAPTRNACYESRFEQERSALQPDFNEFDDAFSYLEYQVCLDPESGIETDSEGIWVARVRIPTPGGVITASAFYAFDATEVTFLSIRQAP